MRSHDWRRCRDTELLEVLEGRVLLAGVTVVTHGFQSDGNYPTWTTEMVAAVERRAGVPGVDTRRLRLTVDEDGPTGTIADVRGTGQFMASGGAEAVVEIDWADASNNSVFPYPGPLVSTVDVAGLAASAVGGIFSTIGITAPLAELPIHLIGHSRGAGVMTELAAALGAMGIWVYQVTLLDPHPLTSAEAWSGGADPAIRLYDNVLYADTYRQTASIVFPNGVAVPETHQVNLTSLPGMGHSEVHEYYQGTIDLGASGPLPWYSAPPFGPRDTVGFARSRLGSLTAYPDGVLNRIGGSAARSPAPLSGLQWPNIEPADLPDGQSFDQTTSVDLAFVYSDRDSGAVVRAFFDVDSNPYNGTSGDAGSVSVSSADFGVASVHMEANGIRAGTYRVGFEITDGGRRRYQYLNKPVTVEYVIYFPEGNSTGAINEYVPIVNPNPFAVSYTVTIRYEWGDRDQLVESGVIPASSRGGLTLYEGAHRNEARVRLDVPYAIEIRSSAPLGAILSHYDFGVATGEAFSPDTATQWTFAQVRRGEGATDFLVWHNPSDVDALVTVTAYTPGGQVLSDTRFTGALRRGGISVNDMPWDISGSFSVVITSTVPIIAALSHYEPATGSGYIAVGDTNGGATDVQAAFGAADQATTLEATVFNPGTAAVSLSIDVLYESGATGSTRTFVLAAGKNHTYSKSDLGLRPGETGYVRVRSAQPLTVSLATNDAARGDGLSTPPMGRAARRWLFGDGYMSNAGAGTVMTEFLSLVNPGANAATITCDFMFLDGTYARISRSVAAHAMTTIRLHEQAAILAWGLQHGGNNWFGVSVSSDTPVIASMIHWDQNQRGGWSSLGTPASGWTGNG